MLWCTRLCACLTNVCVLFTRPESHACELVSSNYGWVFFSPVQRTLLEGPLEQHCTRLLTKELLKETFSTSIVRAIFSNLLQSVVDGCLICLPMFLSVCPKFFLSALAWSFLQRDSVS